ncbi:hydroxyisourate hydrolase [Bacillus sp. B1-b2]|uniref:hydroxyisourate hydrolase n=1 Tax=Bacillus sp. B1-b2 TaxID=2653201 RepID=UPI001262111C|nr:hydroxyisourate hydrolase [Bacillus sp. B1-b2]KAB7671160.1 hydroxyisourate hydrolase [Bacillus sp. B1-b2]
MKTGITSHVLDITTGKPAVGMKVELYQIKSQEKALLSSGITNSDGRVDESLLHKVITGEFELLFYVEEYYKSTNNSENIFFTTIPIRFYTQESETHYHIPLLLSRWGYQTYRGS